MAVFGLPASLWSGGHGDQAHSVELKALIAAPGAAVATALTGRARPRWRTRRLFLIDTADLTLARAGMEIRLRRHSRGRDDLTVRARRRSTGATDVTGPVPTQARVELDVLPDAVWRSVELGRDLQPAEVGAVLDAGAPAGRLLSPAQRAWVLRGGDHPVPRATLEHLVVHGPLIVERAGTRRGPTLGRVRVESCRYPSGRELVEVSTRCTPSDARRCAEALAELLSDLELPLAESHRTKTSVWLDEIGDVRRQDTADRAGLGVSEKPR